MADDHPVDAPSVRPSARESVILVYGDSMCLPSILDNVPVGDTYPELLAETQTRRGIKTRLYSRGEGFRTIVEHAARYTNDQHFFPMGPDDLLILHVGMVDCAPRPLNDKWRSRLDRSRGFIRNPLIRFIRKNRAFLLTHGFAFVKVQSPIFQQRLEEWLDHATRLRARIIVISMPPITQAAEDLSPGWRKRIAEYNRIIVDAVARHPGRVQLIPLHEILARNLESLQEYVSPLDGYHLVHKGHRLIHDLIAEYLESDR
jgi:hypothetical protein